MPSQNKVFEHINLTNLNSNPNTEVFDAVVIANYGDPGLQEDYYADILSRYVICMIESANRPLTFETWKRMIVLVKRPESLWIYYDGNFVDNPVSQRRVDANLNLNVGYASNYTTNNIPKINFPYKMGERIKIKKTEKQDILYSECNHGLYYSKYESQIYGEWHSQGASLIDYGETELLKSILRTKTILPDRKDLSNLNPNKYDLFITKSQYEVMVIKQYGKGMVNLFSPPGPLETTHEYMANGGYLFAYNNPNRIEIEKQGGSVYASSPLNTIEYVDMNIEGKSRTVSNGCIPLVVTTPNSFSVPKVRTPGTINYSPTYITREN